MIYFDNRDFESSLRWHLDEVLSRDIYGSHLTESFSAKEELALKIVSRL